ncbi:MAG TPA: phytoene desaturase family protein [Longimicrobiaceae bacterium]|nr:phytoene desaturase family protein [Longimicrobiaceae bacterium]
MADAIVVGAGVGGLSAAIGLAARGVRVTVLEASAAVGGKMGTAVIDGVEVDTGPSVLTLPGTIDQALRLAGTTLADEVELTQPEPAFRYLYPDGTALDVHGRREDTLASIHRTLGADAAREMDGFLAYAGRIWQAAESNFVRGPAPSPRSLLAAGPDALLAMMHIDPFRRMQAAIESRVRSPHLRWLLMRYATYNGSDPRRAPATLNCIAHVELALGGHGVRGGMHRIARALARGAERLGVEIRLESPAIRITQDRGRATGVETADGKRLAADAVVVNADAAHLFADLLPRTTRRRPRESEPSTSGWVAIVRARRRAGTDARVAHTVAFPADYPGEFADLFDRGRPPADPTVYLCAQEACHGRTGWTDDEPVFVMANAPAEPDGDARPAAVWDALRAAVLRRMDASGLRTAGDEIVWERTPAGLAAAFPGSRGALYGAASNHPLSAFRRPPNRVRGVRGLYLASGSAHPGGGVPLCVLSGRAAAQAALRDLGLAPLPENHA